MKSAIRYSEAFRLHESDSTEAIHPSRPKPVVGLWAGRSVGVLPPRPPHAPLPRHSSNVRAAFAAILLSLLFLTLSPAPAATHWFTRALQEPPGDSPAPQVLFAAQGQTSSTKVATFELFGGGDEWYVIGRLPAAGEAVLTYAGRDGRTCKATIPAAISHASSQRFDVVVALDASQSMARNDPLGLRHAALRHFLNLSRDSRAIRSLSIVVFRTDADVLLSAVDPRDVSSDTESGLARKLAPFGGTSFDKPFGQIDRLLVRELADSAARPAVLFLSDGKPIGRYRDGHRKLGARDCPIYTIGLSEEADGELLGRIASEARGRYFPAPTADELEGIFTEVFRLIAQPEDILRCRVAVPPAKTLTFQVDPGMRNTGIVAAPLSGRPEAFINARTLHPPGAIPEGTDIRPEPSETPHSAFRIPTSGIGAGLQSVLLQSPGVGPHEVTIRGEGRATILVQADTPHGLRAVAVPTEAAAGTPIQIAAFLINPDDLDAVEATCRLRKPGGGMIDIPLNRNAFGLFKGQFKPTFGAGIYELDLVISASLNGAGLQRRTVFSLQRTASPGPARPDRSKAPAELSPYTDRPAASVASIPAPTADLQSPAPDPVGGIWSSVATVDRVLNPGSTAEDIVVTLEVSGALNQSPPVAELDVSAVEGIQFGLSELSRHRRRVDLVLTISASPSSAGTTCSGFLSVRAGELSRRIPIAVRVAVPSIVAELSPFTIERVGRRRLAQARLTAAIKDSGRCDVRIDATDPDLAPLPRDLQLGPGPFVLPLILEVTPTSGRPSLHGEVVVSSPGMEPLRLPYRIDVPGRAGTGRQKTATLWRWLLWVLLAILAIAICVLTVAALRGDRRAAFVLISAAVHAVILLLVVPRSRLEQMAGRVASALSLADSPIVVEESIPAEDAAAPSQASEPEAPDHQKAVTEQPDPEPVPSRDIPAVPPEPEPPEPEVAETPVPPPEPPSLEPQPAPDSPPVPPVRRLSIDLPTDPEPVAAFPVLPETHVAAPDQARARDVDLDALAVAESAPVPVPGRPARPERSGPDLREAPPSIVTAPKQRVSDAPWSSTPPVPPVSDPAMSTLDLEMVQTVAIVTAELPTMPAPVLSNPVRPAALQVLPTSPESLDISLAELSDPEKRLPENRQSRAPAATASRPVEARTNQKPNTTEFFDPGEDRAGRAIEPDALAMPEPVKQPLQASLTVAAIPPDSVLLRAPKTLPGPDRGRLQAKRAATELPVQPEPVRPDVRRRDAPVELPLNVIEPMHLPELQSPAPDIQELATDPRLIGQPAGPSQATAVGDTASPWHRTFANLRHSGDWDCDRTAMLNLAHQYERRTGSLFPYHSRTVSVAESETSGAPFLFMSGHNPFRFAENEATALTEYLKNGGYLWINDSTDIGNDAFDAAVRSQLHRLFPGSSLKPIPFDHPIFQGPYDLANGFGGFRVPPGDKYRTEYLEGLWIGDRLAVVYTRNDYGDGLEIDPRTAPLMQSLTDLSPVEMQEASVQMGINLAGYFIHGGNRQRTTLSGNAPALASSASVSLLLKSRPLEFFESTDTWSPPQEQSPDYLRVTAIKPADDPGAGLVVEFDAGETPFVAWRSKVILECPVDEARIDGQSVLFIDVESRLSSGARVALAFSGDGPIGYLETTAMFIRPGDNPNLQFDLRQAIFKSQRTHWKIGDRFPPDFQVRKIHLLIYPQGPSGTVACTNLRIAQP